MGGREEKKRQTRQALAEAALELFRVRGFDDTRVQDIVQRAGVSPATFFNYFPSKDAVLEARAEESMALYAALLRHELDRDEASVEERLRQITSVLGIYLSADVEISRLMTARTQLFMGVTGHRADDVRAAQRLLADLFAQGQRAGEIIPHADPEQLSELYTAMVVLTSTNWLIGWWESDSQPLGERMLTALDLLLGGVRQHPPRHDPDLPHGRA